VYQLAIDLLKDDGMGSLAGVFGFTIVSSLRVDSTTPVIYTLFNVPDIIMNVNREEH